MYLCIRVASGPRVKLASCKSALTRPPPPPSPSMVCSTDRSKAVVPVLVLLLVALWFILRGDLSYFRVSLAHLSRRLKVSFCDHSPEPKAQGELL